MNRERLEKIKAAYGQPMKDGNYPDEMIAEIEKCWAITELAVKELKSIAEVELKDFPELAKFILKGVNSTLAEIARLST